MSDNTLNAIKKHLRSIDKAKPSRVMTFHEIELSRGKRAKRVIDMQRTNQNYYNTKLIQLPLLDHYENVDWYERSYQYDFE